MCFNFSDFFLFQIADGLDGRALNAIEAVLFKITKAVLATPATAPTTPKAIPAAVPEVMV